jgi:Skp family chaperone for outer membrane proteins
MRKEYLISALVRVSKVAALCAVLAVAPIIPVHAQDAKVGAESLIPKIAVVDLQMLVAESNAGKSIRAQISKQRDAYRVQIEKQEAELVTLDKKLAIDQAKMTKEEFTKKRKEFQDKIVAAQRSVQQRRVAFDKAYSKAMETLREHIVKIVADISTKQKITLVLNRQDVVLVDSKLDLSKEVLVALNAKVSSIPATVN